MSDVQLADISSILTESLLLNTVGKDSVNDDKFQKFQAQLQNLPSVLDESTLTKLKNGGYEISLQEYTNMNTYNTMMSTLYGNNSANKFQNILNILTDSEETDLATAKSFVDKMKANGMSNATAVRTYAALQKYSLISSFGKYNFVNAKA